MKYRYTITHEGVVDVDTPAEAEAAAFEQAELGAGIVVCEVEPLTRGTERDD